MRCEKLQKTTVLSMLKSMTVRTFALFKAETMQTLSDNIPVKVRYRHTEQPATVIQTGDDSITVEFDEPQRAITKGQAVVLYDDTVLGGGTIK